MPLEYRVTPETTNPIMEAGATLCADEICLPVKLHFGHLQYLQEQEGVDLLFSPGFGRWGRRSHFCPKLIGLPDLVGLQFTQTAVFRHELDAAGRFAKEPWLGTIREIMPTVNKRVFTQAWKEGERRQAAFFELCRKGYLPPKAIEYLCGEKDSVEIGPALLNLGKKGKGVPRILVLGHPYMVYDNLAGQGLLQTLVHDGVQVFTKEMTPAGEVDKYWPTQEKRVFWTLGQQILSAAYYFVNKRLIDGIIFHTACLCGPDALIGDLLEKYLAREEKAPALLKLTVDEHTGYAGLQTRVEAFLDLLKWRRQYAAV